MKIDIDNQEVTCKKARNFFMYIQYKIFIQFFSGEKNGFNWLYIYYIDR